MNRPIIRTIQDLRNQPRFQASVDPALHPLSRILTGYHLNEEFPCGLKSCHQPHKEGYLVELEDGHLTNVGWKCGDAFGDRFNAERTRYAERVLRPTAIRTVGDLVVRLQGMQKEMAQLASEADRLSQCKQGMSKQFPKLYADLKRRAHAGDDRIVESVARTKAEIDDLQAMNPGTPRDQFRYRQEGRGVLPGLRTLANNIRDDVVVQFTSKASELLATTVATLPTDKLLEWEGWAHRFDDTLARARSAIEAGKAFFAPQSFQLMVYVATVDLERAALRKASAESLVRGDGASPTSGGTAAAKLPMSKKERDIRKRLEATLRNAEKYGR